MRFRIFRDMAHAQFLCDKGSDEIIETIYSARNCYQQIDAQLVSSGRTGSSTGSHRSPPNGKQQNLIQKISNNALKHVLEL